MTSAPHTVLRWGFVSMIMLVIGVAWISPAWAWQSDRGDGTYSNPPLYADYPDPDIIRVGEDFYFATTTFANSPGLTLLHSRDLVNWKIVSHVIPRLEGREQYDLKNGTAYRVGVFAPSLRHHNGTFYIAVTPVKQNTRIYYAKNITGPWQYHELDREAFDPGMHIESDGTGYIATSGGWDGHVTLMKLSRDFSHVIEAREIFYYKGIEGSKIIKRGDWYYIFNALPAKLALTCSRSKSLFGPYETILSLDDTKGGHQGAIVDLPDGSWYGFIMKDCGAVGRMTFLSPIFWRDDWPVWGMPEAPGQVPPVAQKPIQGKPLCQPATSDDFESATLGLQWLWNHNPDNARWSLAERSGWLRLRPTMSADFWHARNTLTQKGQGPVSYGVVKLDLHGLKPGDICGFGTLGKVNGYIAAECQPDGSVTLAMHVIVDGGAAEIRTVTKPVTIGDLYLRTSLDFLRNKGACAYSLDGTQWTALGGEFDLAFDWRTGTFQGEQFAIFCYNPNPGEGYADIDWFRFQDSLPADVTNKSKQGRQYE
jgi:beta-xylosidase